MPGSEWPVAGVGGGLSEFPIDPARPEPSGVDFFSGQIAPVLIARRNTGNATTLLEGVPGVRLQYTGHGVRIVSSRDANGLFQRTCTGYLVDGQYVSRGPSGDDQFLPPPRDIIGIEVYQPGEPIGGRPPSNCLTVLLWTKAMFNGD